MNGSTAVIQSPTEESGRLRQFLSRHPNVLLWVAVGLIGGAGLIATQDNAADNCAAINEVRQTLRTQAATDRRDSLKFLAAGVQLPGFTKEAINDHYAETVSNLDDKECPPNLIP